MLLTCYSVQENRCFPEGTNLKDCLDMWYQCCSMEVSNYRVLCHFSFPALQRHYSIPKIRNKYSQKWNCSASFPVPIFMFRCAICIFPRSVCLFSWRKCWALVRRRLRMHICSELLTFYSVFCKLISNQLMEKALFLCLLTNQLQLFYFPPALVNLLQ